MNRTKTSQASPNSLMGHLIELRNRLLKSIAAVVLVFTGWLYEFRPDGELLTAEQYLEHLRTAWEEAQRTIKGQMNEG